MISDVLRLNISSLGQVFTPESIVNKMLSLVRSTKRCQNPRFLEPSCGNGAFFKHLPQNKVGIELDRMLIESVNNTFNKHTQSILLNIDFFNYDVSEKFDCIIGNPPYVRYQDILDSTKLLLSSYKNFFDLRSNLYLFFIYKSLLHLKDKGELIFITPRDFLKSTASIKLNHFIS